MANPYQVLGVSANASDEEIRERYRELLKQYNNDLSLPSPTCDIAKSKIIELNNAYDEIMNMRRGGTHQTSQFSDIRRYTGNKSNIATPMAIIKAYLTFKILKPIASRKYIQNSILNCALKYPPTAL